MIDRPLKPIKEVFPFTEEFVLRWHEETETWYLYGYPEQSIHLVAQVRNVRITGRDQDLLLETVNPQGVIRRYFTRVGKSDLSSIQMLNVVNNDGVLEDHTNIVFDIVRRNTDIVEFLYTEQRG